MSLLGDPYGLGLHFLDGDLVGYDRNAPDLLMDGMLQQQANNEAAMRAYLNTHAMPPMTDLRGMQNAWPVGTLQGPCPAPVYNDLNEARAWLRRTDWVYLAWLLTMTAGLVARWLLLP